MGISGASVSSDVADVVKVITSGDTTTTTNVGTVGTGVTALEQGTGVNHVTTLTLSGVAYTVGDATTLGVGALIYTFPAGVIVVDAATVSVGLTLTTGTPTTDAPELGLGSVIASGVVANLSTPATFEDILTGTAVANVAGTALVATVQTTLVIPAASAHTVHLNFADAWQNLTNSAATAAGTVTLKWAFLS